MREGRWRFDGYISHSCFQLLAFSCFFFSPPSCAQSRASHHVRIINVLHKDLWKRSEISFLKKKKKVAINPYDSARFMAKATGRGGWGGGGDGVGGGYGGGEGGGRENQYSGDEDRLVRRR